ncbi:MAG: hypothetical protein QT00_C0001G0517 [archaeon GW2011_AR5]|nr:MAG: hypothetical protein QT00_C0001G0517 [archaeon GW2011_AR5]
MTLPEDILNRIHLARELLSGVPVRDIREYEAYIGGCVPKTYRPIDQRLSGYTPAEKSVLVREMLQANEWQ